MTDLVDNSPNRATDDAIAKLEAISDRLQRGEITLEQADAEGLVVQASLRRELAARIDNTGVSKHRSRSIFEASTGTDAFPRLSAVWSTLFLLVCVAGGLFLVIRGMQRGLIVPAMLLSVVAVSGGLLYYSRHHPSRSLRQPVQLFLALLCLASIAGLVIVRTMGV